MIEDFAPVGILSATAIGSILTQNTLDTFHSAGNLNNLVTSGFSRIVELFNNTNSLNKLIYTVKTLNLPRDIISTTLKDLCLELCTVINNDKFTIRIKLSIKKQLSRGKIILNEIENYLKVFNVKIENVSPFIREKDDIITLISLVYNGDKEKIINSVFNVLDYYTEWRDTEGFFYEKILLPSIRDTKIMGYDEIEDIIENGEETLIVCSQNAVMTREIWALDPYNIRSNHITEMENIYGIEVARQCLIEELKNIMPNILVCHILLIVDVMTWSGTIASISRYSSRKDPDVLKRCSFEELKRNIVQACVSGEVDKLKSFSSRIITSKIIL